MINRAHVAAGGLLDFAVKAELSTQDERAELRRLVIDLLSTADDPERALFLAALDYIAAQEA